MKKKILIVEDDNDLCEIYKFILKEYDVINCNNVKDAINMIKKEKPNLTIVDLVLPDADGIELIKTLKNDNPDANIIAISGFIDNFRKNLEKLGIKAMLKKPFKKDDVLRAVKDILHAC